jgi:CRP-like cAMP-binding protein
MIEHKIFKRLTPQEAQNIYGYFEEVEYNEGDIVVKEGEYASFGFILLEGEISILKATIYKDDYLKTDISAPSDEFFCEINLIDRGFVESTIIANSDIKILKIEHDDFIELLDTYPKIGVKLLWIISYDLTKYLRKANKDIITLFNALVEVVEND